MLPTDTAWWLATMGPHTSTPLSILHTLGTSMAVLGLCLLITRRARRWLNPLVWAGTMPLSTYTLHVLLTSLVLAGWVDQWLSLLAQLIVLGSLASWWATRFGQGPLETVLSALARAASRHLVSAPAGSTTS
ncbi:MAG: hypothetical protein CSB46_11550 [Micrococcales bacterium]|nr:MAG: hypothetical protein CSB46_11550 [Micrococcales bacterium]